MEGGSDPLTPGGIATSASGEKMAWLKDSEGNLISFGTHQVERRSAIG